MHNLAFRLKRAHLQNLIFSRPIAARFALTPARFDLLFAISNFRHRTPRQFDLRGILGLAASTISKMLARLEELSLVLRRPDPRDGRHRLITLTREGQRRIDDASEEIIVGVYEAAEIQETYSDAMHTPAPPLGGIDPELAELLESDSSGAGPFDSLGRLFSLARRFAYGLGDRASLVFPIGD